MRWMKRLRIFSAANAGLEEFKLKARYITAVVAIALFILLLFFLPPLCLTIMMGFLCAVGVWELLFATGSCPKHFFLWFSCAAAFAVPFTVSKPNAGLFPFLAVVALYLIGAFCCAVFDHTKITYATLAKGFLAALVMPLLFASVLRIYNSEYGRLLVLMPWVTVWACDSMALYVGKALGKKKLAPYVSPHKTVAGAVGGEIGGVLFMAAYVLVLRKFFSFSLAWMPALLFGLFGAAVGQIGDLSLSVIKREAGIKDYGKLFPGHGGVWDRFDSILFVAPMFELLYLHILPLIGA